MKKLIALSLAGTLVLTSLSGCRKVEKAPETEAKTEAVTEEKTEAVTEEKTEAVTEAKTEAVTEAETASEADTKADAEADTEAKDAAETEADTEAVTEVEAASEAGTEAGAEAVSEEEIASEADTEAGAGADSETEAESAVEADTEAGAETEAGSEVESASEAGTEAQDAAETEIGTEASTEAASKELSGEVVVYNWGEYLDPEVIEMFEEETGVKVVYEEFETNEIMYPKVAAGAIAYDVVCPSDYMIQRMIENDLLQEIDFSNIPNISNIDEEYMTWSEEFDPGNKYSVPYCWGTVGILYNKTMVEEPIDSWDVLWDEQYKDNILMQDSVRDAMMVALKKLGYSMNTTDENEVSEATDLLIEQKPLVQAYVIDQVRDKMIGDEAALGVIYSGEAIYTQRENENLEYVIPKEGTNLWIDSWVIPKNAQNKENAEAFINFLCRADIALMNFDYITYSTPNKAARELIEDEEIRNSTIAFPTPDMLENCETYQFLGDEADEMYANYWNTVKAS